MGRKKRAGGKKKSEKCFGAELLGILSDIGGMITGENRGGNQTGYIDASGNYHQRTCFVKGTPVSTTTGKKPVESVKEGDIVFAKDEKTGNIVPSKVQQTYVRKTDRIFKLEYEDGTVIETTATHPFFIDGKGFVEAQFLKEGDRSVRKDSATLAISHIIVDNRDETVYNFTVEENHNYFVGDSEVLVHNVAYLIPVVAGIGMALANNPVAQRAITSNAGRVVSTVANSPAGQAAIKQGGQIIQGVLTKAKDIYIAVKEDALGIYPEKVGGGDKLQPFSEKTGKFVEWGKTTLGKYYNSQPAQYIKGFIGETIKPTGTIGVPSSTPAEKTGADHAKKVKQIYKVIKETGTFGSFNLNTKYKEGYLNV